MQLYKYRKVGEDWELKHLIIHCGPAGTCISAAIKTESFFRPEMHDFSSAVWPQEEAEQPAK